MDRHLWSWEDETWWCCSCQNFLIKHRHQVKFFYLPSNSWCHTWKLNNILLGLSSWCSKRWLTKVRWWPTFDLMYFSSLTLLCLLCYYYYYYCVDVCVKHHCAFMLPPEHVCHLISHVFSYLLANFRPVGHKLQFLLNAVCNCYWVYVKQRWSP